MTRMPAALKATIAVLVSGIEPTDDLGRDHRRHALSWLAGTDDIARRAKPGTPSPHLVSYFLLIDRPAGSVLLCDHRLSGLWLPSGGHVEPGEHPLDTVRREAIEELGVTALFDEVTGGKPFFLTMTETVGPPAARHVDVSLWFALTGRVEQRLQPDQREFVRVRWWTVAELRRANPGRFEPHLLRALDALELDQ
jgi:8-oxo-dGTP diphosphatase